jgi:phosphoribosylformylglycinamidine synthase
MLAGGLPERLHVNRILEAPHRLAEFQILCLPGGFSYGDDIAAGRILGNQIRHRLSEVLQSFRDAGKLIIGICNGFQILMKTDLLVASDATGPKATLAANESGKFEDRWVRLSVASNKCVFLAGIAQMELPVAHGEGRFKTRDDATLTALNENGQLVLKYEAQVRAGAPPLLLSTGGAGDGLAHATRQSTVPYPDNPNGAIENIAGICDETGRVFGLMPHPERFIDATQHPNWTRAPRHDGGDGLRVFQNSVRYFR